MPGGLACIRPWSVVGVVLLVFSLLLVNHIKGLLECGHLSSVSHVPAIACAFALRECISLVSQPFPTPLYLLLCPAMWFPEYVWGSACETHSTFSHGVHVLSKTHFHKAKCWSHRPYIHWLCYDLKACCWTILDLWAWRVSWQPFQFAFEFTADGQVVYDGRPQVHKLMNDL